MTHSDSAFPAIPLDTVAAAAHVLPPDSAYRALAGGMEGLFDWCRAAAPAGWTSTQVVAFVQETVVTLLQLTVPLSDWQAAEASHASLEWKYAFHRSLSHPGLRAAELCHFRQRLLADPDIWNLFAGVAAEVKDGGLWPLPETEPEALREALARLCRLNLAEWAAEAMAHALEELATWQPEWLRQVAPAHWYARYAVSGPLSAPVRRGPLTVQEAQFDAAYLLRLLPEDQHPELVQLPAVRRLQCVLGQPGEPKASPICADCGLGACITNGCFGTGLTPTQSRGRPYSGTGPL